MKDPSIGDWVGGRFFFGRKCSTACALCGLCAHLGVGGHECQMARPHLICKDAAPECGCAIMNHGEKKMVKRKTHSIISKATPSTSNGN